MVDDNPPPEPPGLAKYKIPVFVAFGRVIRGNYGEIRLASGAVVAKIQPPGGSWSLTRREEKQPDAPTDFTLRAVFSYVNRDFLVDERFSKEVIVSLVRGQQYRLLLPNPRVLDVQGRSLLIEGVQIEPHE